MNRRIIATIAIGLAALAMACVPPPPPGPALSPTPAAAPGLLVPSRDRLRVCVQVMVAATDPQTARAQVAQALAAASRHPRWGQAGLGAAPPQVALGCPREPNLLRPGVAFTDGKPLTDPESAFRVVETPSPHLVHVFVLPPQKLAEVIRGRHSVRRIPEEFVCREAGAERLCGPVTIGLYFAPHELGAQDFVTRWLLRAAGLEPLFPTPPTPAPGGPP